MLGSHPAPAAQRDSEAMRLESILSQTNVCGLSCISEDIAKGSALTPAYLTDVNLVVSALLLSISCGHATAPLSARVVLTGALVAKNLL